LVDIIPFYCKSEQGR